MIYVMDIQLNTTHLVKVSEGTYRITDYTQKACACVQLYTFYHQGTLMWKLRYLTIISQTVGPRFS